MIRLGIKVGTAVAALCLTVGTAFAQNVSFASNPQGTVTYQTTAAIAKLARESGIDVTITPLGGDAEIIPAVNFGEYDFNIGNIVSATYAYRGMGAFKKPQENLRIAAIVYGLSAGMMVRADSDIHSIADLKGKRVTGEYSKLKSFSAFSSAALASAGLTYDDVEIVRVQSAPQAIQDFIAGKADATLITLDSALVKQAHASVGGVRFLPIEDSEMARAGFDKYVPGTAVQNIEASPQRPGVAEPYTPAMTGAFVLMTSADVSDDKVYEITRLLGTSSEELAEMHQAFSSFTREGMKADLPIPFHPGALKFYEETQ